MYLSVSVCLENYTYTKIRLRASCTGWHGSHECRIVRFCQKLSRFPHPRLFKFRSYSFSYMLLNLTHFYIWLYMEYVFLNKFKQIYKWWCLYFSKIFLICFFFDGSTTLSLHFKLSMSFYFELYEYKKVCQKWPTSYQELSIFYHFSIEWWTCMHVTHYMEASKEEWIYSQNY